MDMQANSFQIHRWVINYTLPNQPCYLIPFGDIHYGAPLCHNEKWDEFCEWGAEKDRSYYLGMGDYLDLISESERLAFSNANFHESTVKTIEEVYTELTEKFCEKIKFMKGKIIGLLEGNHFGVFQNGMTTTQLMCQILGCRYLGCSAFIKVSFKYAKGTKRRSIDIWAHHGRGAARLVGGSLNSVEQMMSCANADIYLMGHDHKKSIGMKSILELTDGGNGNVTLRHKKILMARTGSFLKGYEPGEPSYVAKKMLSPTDLGVVKVELTPRIHSPVMDGKQVERMWIDIHASL